MLSRINGKMGWGAAWLLSLPAIAMAQQIAVSGGYPVPTANSQPQGITAGPDGALWYTEISGNKIGRITTAGAVTEYPVPTSGGEPAGITAGPDGALWFTEEVGNKVGRVTTAGAFAEYPIPTANSFPNGIAPGPDGAVWFTESAGNKIGRITTAGIIAEYPLPSGNSGPAGITAVPDGALWFTEANKIGRITTGGVITEYPVTPNSQPQGITAGPDGALWFTEYIGNKIGRITTAGIFTDYPLPPRHYASFPYGITAGPDGALWFTESFYAASKIGRITTAGVITEYPVPNFQSEPKGITTGPDGQLWFTEFLGNRIGEVFFLTATLSVSPAGGSLGAKLSFAGTSFAPNETVQIYLSGVGSPVLASGTADSSGSFTAAARVPPWPYGPRLFVGGGQTSGKLGAASFSISPRLILQPTSGPVGSTVTAQGAGFGSLEQVTIAWLTPNTVLGTATANVNGTFSGTAALTFTVPSATASGLNKVEALGKTTGAKAYASFTVQ